MIDWSDCPAVHARSGYLSGRPALRDDPCVPPETIVDNLDVGETPQPVIENYGLTTSLRDVLTLYAHVTRALVASPI